MLSTAFIQLSHSFSAAFQQLFYSFSTAFFHSFSTAFPQLFSSFSTAFHSLIDPTPETIVGSQKCNTLIPVVGQVGCDIVVLYCFAFAQVLIAAGRHDRAFCHQSRIYKGKAYINHVLVSMMYSSKFRCAYDIVLGTIRPHNYSNLLLSLEFLSPHLYF